MIAVGLALALVTSCATAATLRFRSAAAFLLAAYVLLVAEIVLVVELLSIFRAVRRREVLALEALLLACAGIALVRRRASARVPLPRPRVASLDLRRHPALTVLLVAVVAALGYELALAVLTPPNNWDSRPCRAVGEQFASAGAASSCWCVSRAPLRLPLPEGRTGASRLLLVGDRRQDELPRERPKSSAA